MVWPFPRSAPRENKEDLPVVTPRFSKLAPPVDGTYGHHVRSTTIQNGTTVLT